MGIDGLRNGRTMRDALIEQIHRRMKEDSNIFFLTGDMGAPALDGLRNDCADRFINVGIAEQNLVNVATGLALEGFVVYAYAIASFFLRAYEQIRINLALSGQLKEINVNLIGVGSGLSYDVSGPTHHCLEDLAIMRALPNMVVFSPSDWSLAEKFVDYSVNTGKPKYVRLDGKPLPRIYDERAKINWDRGFCELAKGTDVCIVSTGYMTHTALKAVQTMREGGRDIGLIDVFLLKPMNEKALFDVLQQYASVITAEEAFIGVGGLDTLVSGVLRSHQSTARLCSVGFRDEYIFKLGDRSVLHKQSGCDSESMIHLIKQELMLA